MDNMPISYEIHQLRAAIFKKILKVLLSVITAQLPY